PRFSRASTGSKLPVAPFFNGLLRPNGTFSPDTCNSDRVGLTIRRGEALLRGVPHGPVPRSSCHFCRNPARPFGARTLPNKPLADLFCPFQGFRPAGQHFRESPMMQRCVCVGVCFVLVSGAAWAVLPVGQEKEQPAVPQAVKPE